METLGLIVLLGLLAGILVILLASRRHSRVPDFEAETPEGRLRVFVERDGWARIEHAVSKKLVESWEADVRDRQELIAIMQEAGVPDTEGAILAEQISQYRRPPA
jgi:hypothetical protein